ncbi:hypothetical protein Vadar_019438 [Vaccinium darrowii]|uniref:Uncharacterized protein n=1 Tax=Vaccinium darrowii TaxID=229202 RepID=A0ACB7Y105_9ERIC|nr:hypothetical protein Vadar_019438 [Vaccinium darrowii]
MAAFPLSSPSAGHVFRPTDEELVDFYLRNKINGNEDAVNGIPEVDLCKEEPWDVAAMSLIKANDDGWVFFCPIDRKYRTRATAEGYWKATGRDRLIEAVRGKRVIGVKKTLVFYTGHAPKGLRTNWVIYEYRATSEELDVTKPGQRSFVLYKLFKKYKKKIHRMQDDTFSISDHERTSGTTPAGVVSYKEESMGLNEMGEVVTKRQKLSLEDIESLTGRETDEVSNSSEEEPMEEMWSEETPSDPRPTISHHFSILHVLDLSYTEIKSLPQSISRLVALQKLYLRNCERLMQLPPEIGELTNLEVLDLEGTEILCLPKEIAKLVKLMCLKVSFYGYAIQTVIRRKVLPNLSRLNELIIDVTPYREWWDVKVEAIIDDLRSLKELRALKLYLPTAKLLEELKLIVPSLAIFRFTVGRCEEHFICRLPRDIEEEFNNKEKLEKGLMYVNGDRIPNEITKVFNHVNAFFLQCHWTANSLSEFGHENLNEVKFCLVMECNEFRTIIDSEQFYQGNDCRAKSEYFQDFDEAIVLGSLERLIVRYMKNMESIWKGPLGKGSMSSLKSLALHTCPNLTTLFTIDMLSNLINLEELIVEDCPKIDSLVSLKNSGSKSGLFLPSLKKISLLELPGLVSISSGLFIAQSSKSFLPWISPVQI